MESDARVKIVLAMATIMRTARESTKLVSEDALDSRRWLRRVKRAGA